MAHADIRVIINPASGINRRKLSVIAEVEKVLGKSAEVVYTRKQGHATRLAKEAVDKKYKAVVAVGGDGSINECASALVHTDTALGIIPAGSGNGLARCLEIPFRIEKAVECIRQFNTLKMDAFTINKHWVFSIAGFGLDARIARQYALEKQRGFYPYLRLTLQEYLNADDIPFELSVNARKIRSKALFVSIANSNQFGYDTIVSDKARVDDGLLDLCIFNKVPLIQIPVIAPLFFLHKLDYTDYYYHEQAATIKVSKRKGRYVNIDGEAVRMSKKLRIKIHPGVLNVIVC